MFILNPRLASDIFDGEYIIANLDTGLYYSIQGLAVALVNALPFEAPSPVILKLSEAFPDHSDAIQKELAGVFQELQQEDIIRESATGVAAEPGLYTTPERCIPSKFNRYADMQDLLLLDPIHDVDEDGWTVKNDEKA